MNFIINKYKEYKEFFKLNTMKKYKDFDPYDYSDDSSHYSEDNEDIDDNNNDNLHLNDEENNDNKNINEFEGSNNQINGWKQCYYCQKYHPKNMHLDKLEYCGHCWAWLNSNQIDLTNGKYSGDKSMKEILNFLKLTYPLHSTLCNNVECIYNKIHYLISNELGFKNEIKENKENKENKMYKIKKAHLNPIINYNLSKIAI